MRAWPIAPAPCAKASWSALSCRSTATGYSPKYDNYVSIQTRPAERFSDPRWKMHKSSEGQFYLFDSITLFKFGTLVLLCPPEVANTYKSTLHYKFLSFHTIRS